MFAKLLQARSVLAGVCFVALTALGPSDAAACPFCSAVSMTLSEEMKTASVAVLAKMVSQPKAADENDAAAQSSLDATPLKFEIIEHLKGGDLLAEVKEFEVIYFGQGEEGSVFLVMGADPPTLVWGTPLLLSEAAVEYVRQLPKLPEGGADRLKYFQEHLNSSDDLLSRDAYDEFARAPYADVKGLKEHMNLPELRAAVMDKELPASRRRLFFTMLGVCGGADDIPLLEQMLTANDPLLKTTLDAMIACYLTLKGPDGLTLIEDQFFRRKEAEFTDTYAAIVALRFHGQEETIVPKERLVQAFRLMLDRPNYADLVIPDLARWEDWQSMERLVTLFKEADDDSSWVRVPVVQFLRQCPLPEAKERIAELEKIDPDAVKRANSFLPFAVASAAVPPAGGGEPTPADPAAPTDPFTAAGKSVQEQLSQANGAADEAEGEPTQPIAAAAPSGNGTAAAQPSESSTARKPGHGLPQPFSLEVEPAATPPAADSPSTSQSIAEPSTSGEAGAKGETNSTHEPSPEPPPSSNMILAVVGGSLAMLALLYLTFFGGRAAGSR